MNHILLLAAAAGLPDAVGRERAELHGALQQRIFRRGFEPVQQHVETGKPFRGRIEISGQVVVAERKIVPEERPCEVSEMEPIFQPAAFGVHPDQVLQLRPAQENGTGAQRITLSRDAVFITAASAGQPGNGEKRKAGRSRNPVTRFRFILYSHSDSVVAVPVGAKNDPGRNVNTGKRIFICHITQSFSLVFCSISGHNIKVALVE